MAFVIPLEVKGSDRGPVVLVIVLTKDNWARMREGDPFDLKAAAYADQLNLERPLGSLDLVIAYEENEAELMAIARAGGFPALMKRLERGRKHRPELGDTMKPVIVKHG
jgi:hypothetical protein